MISNSVLKRNKSMLQDAFGDRLQGVMLYGFLAAAIGAVLVGCHKNRAGGAAASRPSGQAQAATSQKVEKIREPAVAGLFYPRDKQALAKAVDAYLAAAKDQQIKELRGLICPHAGYRYSGPTAAIGYKQLAGRDIQTVVVLAPTHYASFNGASIPPVDAYRTPLGLIRLSPKAAELAGTAPFVSKPACRVQRPRWWKQAPKELPAFGKDTPHTWEHSLEVQLPFLQRVLKGFRLVPAVFGDVDPKAVAKTLAKYLDDKTLIVASSDLSHFYRYSTAKVLDAACTKAICSLDIEGMAAQEACGKGPILTLMHIAKARGWQAKLLDYRNSGDTAGDKSNVVGYAAIAFFAAGKGATTAPATAPASKPATQAGIYTPEERKFLLDLARKTITAAVNTKMIPRINVGNVPKKLTEERGCFVTLTKDGRLCGCIGYIFPKEPLYKAVIKMAYSAATRDKRFSPVKPDELDKIHLEISVLTAPKPLEFKSPDDLLLKLRPRIDGVVLKSGHRQATYLPQVWKQMPSRNVFLTRLSMKAGLGPQAWRQDGVSVLVYQAEAFGEGER